MLVMRIFYVFIFPSFLFLFFPTSITLLEPNYSLNTSVVGVTAT